jgi:hypothetical protein
VARVVQSLDILLLSRHCCQGSHLPRPGIGGEDVQLLQQTETQCDGEATTTTTPTALLVVVDQGRDGDTVLAVDPHERPLAGRLPLLLQVAKLVLVDPAPVETPGLGRHEGHNDVEAWRHYHNSA